MNAIDAALAFAIKSYAKPASATIKEDRPIKVTTPKVKSVKVETDSKSAPKAEPIAFKPASEMPKVFDRLPEKGTLDAKGFLVTMRRATDRNAKINAIASYVGYDVAGDYGSQELAANLAAKRELRPIDASGPSRQERRIAQRSAMGFVSGMPDSLRVRVQDLLGREKMAADQMISHQKDASTALEAGNTELHSHHLGLALLEKERIVSIQAELRTLVG